MQVRGPPTPSDEDGLRRRSECRADVLDDDLGGLSAMMVLLLLKQMHLQKDVAEAVMGYGSRLAGSDMGSW